MNTEHSPMPVRSGGDLIESGHPTAGGASEEPNPVKTILSLMRGRWPWAIGLALLFGLIGGAAGYLLPVPVYRSTGLIHIDPVQPVILFDLPDKRIDRGFDSFLASQATFIRSPRVVAEAMRHEAWRGLGDDRASIDLAEFTDRLDARHVSRSEYLQVSYESPEPEIARQAVKSVVDSYEKIYQDRNSTEGNRRFAELEQRRNSLERELRSLERQRNTLAEEFGGYFNLQTLHQLKLQEVNRYEQELRNLDIVLSEAESLAGTDPQQPEGSPAPPPAGGGNEAAEPAPDALPGLAAAPDLPGSNLDAGGANADAGEPGPELSGVDDGPSAESVMGFTPEMIAEMDTRMARYLEQKRTLRREISQLRLTLGEDHREILHARELMAWIDQEIEEYAADFRRRYANGSIAQNSGPNAAQTIEQLRDRIQRTRRVREAAQQQAIVMGQRRQEIERIRGQEQDAQARLRQTQQRIDELEIESGVDDRLTVVSDGDMPNAPYRDKRRVGAVMGGGLGGGLGLGLVLLVGLLDRRLRSMDDAHDNLGRVPMLGILPRLPDDLADPEQTAIAAHCVHQIRTLLQIGPESHGQRAIASPNAHGGDDISYVRWTYCRAFAITSPGANNGKTSLTLALGMSFAASGARTLMVDCDMTGGAGSLTDRVDRIIRRRIGMILQREQLVTEEQVEEALFVAQETGRLLGETLIELGYLHPEDLEQALTLQEQMPIGLLDALGGEPLEHCVAATGIRNLSILPIGAAGVEDVSRVAPLQSGWLLDRARRLYDVVLVDTGPIPGSLEASHVVREADGVVLVVSRGQQRNHAEKAIDHLQSIDAEIAGLVFNRAEGRDVEQVSESSARSQRGVSTNGHGTGWARAAADPAASSRFGPVARAVASSSNKPSRNEP